MDFDARIEAFAARHEALTMNLELLSCDHEDTNRRVTRLWKAATRNSSRPASQELMREQE